MTYLNDVVVNSKLTPAAWELITEASTKIIARYYPTYDREDLHDMLQVDLAEFLLRLADNVTSGASEKPRSLRNVIFTRARNSCSNYLMKTYRRPYRKAQALREYVAQRFAESDGEPYACDAYGESLADDLALYRHFHGEIKFTHEIERV